jgi:hypothetical protein
MVFLDESERRLLQIKDLLQQRNVVHLAQQIDDFPKLVDHSHQPLLSPPL